MEVYQHGACNYLANVFSLNPVYTHVFCSEKLLVFKTTRGVVLDMLHRKQQLILGQTCGPLSSLMDV